MITRNIPKEPPAIRNERFALIPTDSIQEHPENPNQGDTGAIVESITEFGFVGAVIVQASTRYVLAGNHTLKAAKFLGMPNIQAVIVDMEDSEARAFLLAHNETARRAAYDKAALLDLLRAVEYERGLEGTGFDTSALDDLARDLAEPLAFPLPSLGGNPGDTLGAARESGSGPAQAAEQPADALTTYKQRMTTDEAAEISAGVQEVFERGGFESLGAALRYCVSETLKAGGFEKSEGLGEIHLI